MGQEAIRMLQTQLVKSGASHCLHRPGRDGGRWAGGATLSSMVGSLGGCHQEKEVLGSSSPTQPFLFEFPAYF